MAARRRGWGRATPTVYNGVKYDSKAEALYAQELDEQMANGSILRWDRQQRWPLRVAGVKVCTMIPDFTVWVDDERMELHEVKGYETPVYKLKRKLFAALHPDIPYFVISAKDLHR